MPHRTYYMLWASAGKRHSPVVAQITLSLSAWCVFVRSVTHTHTHGISFCWPPSRSIKGVLLLRRQTYPLTSRATPGFIVPMEQNSRIVSSTPSAKLRVGNREKRSGRQGFHNYTHCFSSVGLFSLDNTCGLPKFDKGSVGCEWLFLFPWFRQFRPGRPHGKGVLIAHRSLMWHWRSFCGLVRFYTRISRVSLCSGLTFV